jgi:hypothetical protein
VPRLIYNPRPFIAPASQPTRGEFEPDWPLIHAIKAVCDIFNSESGKCWLTDQLIPYQRQLHRAHRLMWNARHPEARVISERIGWTCGTTNCCNPDHMFIPSREPKPALRHLRVDDGPRTTPVPRKRSDRRGSKPRDYNLSPKSALRAVDIAYMREDYDYGRKTMRVIADEWGVSVEAVRKIVRRETWRHVKNVAHAKLLDSRPVDPHQFDNPPPPPLVYTPPKLNLSDDKVREIRASYTGKGAGSSSVLARRYGVTASTILDVVHRRTWKHVSDTPPEPPAPKEEPPQAPVAAPPAETSAPRPPAKLPPALEAVMRRAPAPTPVPVETPAEPRRLPRRLWGKSSPDR